MGPTSYQQRLPHTEQKQEPSSSPHQTTNNYSSQPGVIRCSRQPADANGNCRQISTSTSCSSRAIGIENLKLAIKLLHPQPITSPRQD
ncbi:hypothetical protein Nepgr_005325 [Nepenthes gracilis]|uniref:Uncharacterized protein n=1 Tax=Nepenthes gracilis TaxID=150966 RepID=A0AAD3S3E1_NEPGR|nr:hypothetical protein Nepgr_005325 [Nepenthes gracilis]